LSSDNNSVYDERKGHRVIQSRQGKTIREIVRDRDASYRRLLYLKKEGLNHGIAIDDDNKKSHSNNEKSTHAYKLWPRKNADTGIHRTRAKRRRSK
jgi:hypothetical protein